MGPSLVLYPGERALQRLIDEIIPRGEQVSLVETIFSSRRATEMVDYLQGKDAQTFIDAVDEVRYPPIPGKRVD